MLAFRFFAALIFICMGSLVCFFNLKVVFRMRKEVESFHKICMNKAMANVMIALAFLIWCAPCSILGYTYLPDKFNVFFGQITGWGPYLMSGPFTQICLAINRSMAINFPYRFNRENNVPVTKIALSALWVIAILMSLPSLKEGCGYIFFVDLVSWGPMDDPCSMHLSEYITFLVIAMASLSFSINLFSIVKIIHQSHSDQMSALRKRRRRTMFIQCILQDCTHSMDVINNTYLYALVDAIWFQFLCGAVSALTVILLDGFLMSVLHQKSATPNEGPTRHMRSSSMNTTTVV